MVDASLQCQRQSRVKIHHLNRLSVLVTCLWRWCRQTKGYNDLRRLCNIRDSRTTYTLFSPDFGSRMVWLPCMVITELSLCISFSRLLKGRTLIATITTTHSTNHCNEWGGGGRVLVYVPKMQQSTQGIFTIYVTTYIRGWCTAVGTAKAALTSCCWHDNYNCFAFYEFIRVKTDGDDWSKATGGCLRLIQ